jgi:hypothetical protein
MSIKDFDCKNNLNDSLFCLRSIKNTDNSITEDNILIIKADTDELDIPETDKLLNNRISKR